MRRRTRQRSLAVAFIVPLVLFAGLTVRARAEMVPDFTLTDTNLTSSTHGQPVSPRNYLDKASAWYFGHAT